MEGRILGFPDGFTDGWLEGNMEGSILGLVLGLEDMLGKNDSEGVADGSSTNGSSVWKVELLQLLFLEGCIEPSMYRYSEPFTLIWKKLFWQVLRILFSENSWHSPATNVSFT